MFCNKLSYVSRVYSGSDRYSDAAGGSSHLTWNVQDLHHGRGITTTLILLWNQARWGIQSLYYFQLSTRSYCAFSCCWYLVLFCTVFDVKFESSLMMSRTVSGVQYSYSIQSSGDIYYLCQPHLCYWRAWEGKTVATRHDDFFRYYMNNDIFI